MKQNKEFLMISDFVSDHFSNFGFYPGEVETDTQVYTFEQYWSVLEAGGYEEK